MAGKLCTNHDWVYMTKVKSQPWCVTSSILYKFPWFRHAVTEKRVGTELILFPKWKTQGKHRIYEVSHSPDFFVNDSTPKTRTCRWCLYSSSLAVMSAALVWLGVVCPRRLLNHHCHCGQCWTDQVLASYDLIMSSVVLCFLAIPWRRGAGRLRSLWPGTPTNRELFLIEGYVILEGTRPTVIIDKQRVLMHRHQGWNVRHGLCHIYMRYLYIYELFIAFVCFVVCSLL